MISSARLLRNFLRKFHIAEAPSLTLAAEVARQSSLVPIQEAKVATAIQCTIDTMAVSPMDIIKLASHMYGYWHRRKGREGSPMEWWRDDKAEDREPFLELAAEVATWINIIRFESFRQHGEDT